MSKLEEIMQLADEYASTYRMHCNSLADGSPFEDEVLGASHDRAHKALESALRAALESAEPVAPTLAECEAAGRGPYNVPGKLYSEGGLPNTPEERARFEAYMRGHCWSVGNYDETLRAYDTIHVRGLYGVWRDRGAIASPPPESAALEALRELVELKALKETFDERKQDVPTFADAAVLEGIAQEYQRRKPAAWEAARVVVEGKSNG